jgi:predicted phage terminase large subunit-like protein
MARFESNQAGGRVAENVQKMVKDAGGRCKITTKYTTANKETKILVNSPFILEHFLFKDNSVIGNDKEYRRFMQFMCGYTMAGRNKYDDVPDALAMFAEYIQSFALNKVEIIKRPF